MRYMTIVLAVMLFVVLVFVCCVHGSIQGGILPPNPNGTLPSGGTLTTFDAGDATVEKLPGGGEHITKPTLGTYTTGEGTFKVIGELEQYSGENTLFICSWRGTYWDGGIEHHINLSWDSVNGWGLK